MNEPTDPSTYGELTAEQEKKITDDRRHYLEILEKTGRADQIKEFALELAVDALARETLEPKATNVLGAKLRERTKTVVGFAQDDLARQKANSPASTKTAV